VDFRDLADGEMEYLHGVIELYQTVLTVKSTLLGQAQNEKVQQLTESSKKISAWAAIIFAPTLIGTVYGMNFDHMPELHWAIGYPLSLLAMGLVSIGLYLLFRRRKWL
jgi:magnesium transporter